MVEGRGEWLGAEHLGKRRQQQVAAGGRRRLWKPAVPVLPDRGSKE